MRKTLLTIGLILLLVAFVYGTADAVTGQCVNCHTMHNSQDGAIMGDGPNDYLIRYACVACHSALNSESMNSTTYAPRVLATNAAPGGQGNGNTNAGGDFYWVDAGSDAKGHDVLELPNAGTDGTLFNTPPGGAELVGGQLTCAGSTGCHGDRAVTTGSMDAIKGAHHDNTDGSRTQASTAGTLGSSYRFLDGIKGLEDTTWNWDETASNHNEYYGDTAALNELSDEDTISDLCGQCHGNAGANAFHSTAGVGSSSPWLRHPTDIALLSSGETSLYNTSDGSTIGGYNLEAPVARSTVPATSSSTVVADGTSIVMCLSCHRAHGSDQDDLLRFQYSNMIAGGSNSGGCFVCHTEKNTVNP